MNNVSEKELLERLSDFPKHQLSDEKRMDILKMLRAQKEGKRKRGYNFQRVAAAAAMLVLILITPLLFLTEDNPGTGSIGEEIKKAEEGVYFALMDTNGKPYYADSNFGIPNKVSLLAPLEWIEDDYRSVSKVMVYLWGEDLDLNQRLIIEGVHVQTGKRTQIATVVLSGNSMDADAAGVTSFSPFNEPGIWNLEFSMGDKKIGSFSIGVKEAYVKVGDSTLLISKQDLLAGSYEDIYLEVTGSDLPTEIELMVLDPSSGEETVFIFSDKEDYTRTDGTKLSLYKGGFTLNHSGEYQFSILGQSEKVEVRVP